MQFPNYIYVNVKAAVEIRSTDDPGTNDSEEQEQFNI